MKVFISWSGARSKAVADLMSDWISCVLQATSPWLSTRDLDRGTVWFGEIMEQLTDANAGIICLTQENKDRPWILFEAGALMKGLSTNRLCTFLVDLRATDIQDPLAQFNHTLPDRNGLMSLVETLNRQMDQPLDRRILKEVFDTYWPSFESKFNRALEENPQLTASEPRPPADMLAEVLEISRGLQQRIGRLESAKSDDVSYIKLRDTDRESIVDRITRDGLAQNKPEDELIRELVRNGYSPLQAFTNISNARKSGLINFTRGDNQV